jgi:hypothetical protein
MTSAFNTARFPKSRVLRISGLAFVVASALLVAAPAHAIEDYYPYSIMTPEPGTRARTVGHSRV